MVRTIRVLENMKLYLWIIISLFVLIVLRVILRGFFWKDRQGNKISFKEFMKRWRTGVEGITPLQST